MITRAITRLLGSLNKYSFATLPNSTPASPALKKVGRSVVANLPQINYATKPKPIQDQRLSSSIAHEMFGGYKKKQKMPNCRYFALQYKNRIYHFFNAYYYPMGRMINRVSCAIRGKTSPHYKNSMSQIKHGDICVIVNIQDPLFTGKKLLFKKFRYHTGFVGHLKERSYRQLLNHKPQLLYHHMLRRCMPKNKLSVKYMENVILVRGPTHDFPQFPQFAPDRKIYQYLPQANLLDMIKNNSEYELVSQSAQGAAEEILGRKVDKYMSDLDKQQARRELDENIEDLSQIHRDVPKFKRVNVQSKKQIQVAKRHVKRIADRYKVVRAPFKVRSKDDGGLKMYTSEKKARKDPNYQILKNQDLQEIDQQLKVPFPLERQGQNPDKKGK